MTKPENTSPPHDGSLRPDLAAAQIWKWERSVEAASDAIHDGARTDDQLRARARSYVEGLMFRRFPQSIPQRDAQILEIGSGLGWIMQAMSEYLVARSRAPRSIVGLDIAPNMIEMAKRRLGETEPFQFVLYDGITVPLPDSSFDFIYSVAALQHVPRPFVFNLFFEIRRLLKQHGFAVLQFLSTSYLPRQELYHSWRHEISNQVAGNLAHWHHFYTAAELKDVLAITGFEYVAVKNHGVESLVCCMSNSRIDDRGYMRLIFEFVRSKMIRRARDRASHA